MTKPTGRPRGRPKTKEYATLMARVPQALADQVQRYAHRKQQSISVVLRDALELLVEEARFPGILSDTKEAQASLASDRHEPLHGAGVSHYTSPSQCAVLSERDAILSDRNETVLDILLSDMKRAEVDALLADTSNPALDAILSDSTPASPEMLSNTQAARPEMLSDTFPHFDGHKHVLGKLCKRRHDYRHTGQSLLQRSNHKCVLCHREQARERRDATRQGPPATTTPAATARRTTRKR